MLKRSIATVASLCISAFSLGACSNERATLREAISCRGGKWVGRDQVQLQLDVSFRPGPALSQAPVRCPGIVVIIPAAVSDIDNRARLRGETDARHYSVYLAVEGRLTWDEAVNAPAIVVSRVSSVGPWHW